MGKIVKPDCDCGAQFTPILIGGGMIDFTTKVYAPFYCDHCGSISQSNLFAKENRCWKCRKKLTMYGRTIGYFSDDESDRFYNPKKVVIDWIMGMDLQYILEDKKYHCPSCKKENLEFLNRGLWD